MESGKRLRHDSGCNTEEEVEEVEESCNER